eukprot:749806-Hanusia_phi.AAC.1
MAVRHWHRDCVRPALSLCRRRRLPGTSKVTVPGPQPAAECQVAAGPGVTQPLVAAANPRPRVRPGRPGPGPITLRLRGLPGQAVPASLGGSAAD